MKYRSWYCWLLIAFPFPVYAQDVFKGYEHLFVKPKSYVVQFTTSNPAIDGDLGDTAWQTAPWTDDFADIEGAKKPAPAFRTRLKMVWTSTGLYIAAGMEEPHIWAKLKQRDTIVYHDNDFEVFIDPANATHQYFEIEVNALNTILDLFMPKPYRNGGKAMLAYNIEGLRSAVKVNGTINDPSDKDQGWTVEMAIPFRSIYIGNQWRPPQDGALWRINFSRVHWETEIVNNTYVKKKNLPEHNWVWSPQGVINMHYPERWGYLLFSKDNNSSTVFELPLDEKRRQYLWLLYYKQKAYFEKYRKYAPSLQELGIKEGTVNVDGTANRLSMEATTRQFIAYITGAGSTVSVNDEGYIKQVKK